MSTFELTAYNTETREIEHRQFTRSQKLADAFDRIPKIQFSDSGHGVVFQSRAMRPGERKRPLLGLHAAHIKKHWSRIANERPAAVSGPDSYEEQRWPN